MLCFGCINSNASTKMIDIPFIFMTNKLFIAGLAALTAFTSGCASSRSNMLCSLDWPDSGKASIAGACRFDQDPSEEGATLVDFYSHDAKFVFPNSNRGVNFERVDSDNLIRFTHNDYVLSIFPEGQSVAR